MDALLSIPTHSNPLLASSIVSLPVPQAKSNTPPELI